MLIGIALAKDLIVTDQSHTKPVTVLQSVESGLDELNAGVATSDAAYSDSLMQRKWARFQFHSRSPVVLMLI